MNSLENTKQQIMQQLQQLCAHCATSGASGGRAHYCPIQSITARVQAIRGVPLLVNNEFRGVLWR